MGCQKAKVDVMHNRAIKLRVWPVINITTEDKNIILKAYSTQKVASKGNFESGNHEAWYI